jgi:D-alanine-D-alanine ligase
MGGPLRIVVLHNAVEGDADAADRDVLVQAAAVQAALTERGRQVTLLPCTLNLQAAADQLHTLRPDVVFNLVESLGGTDRLMPLATLLLEALGIPFTGVGTTAILATSDKLAAKHRLSQAGLPTPEWWTAETIGDLFTALSVSRQNRRVILKPVWEHASLGMGDDSVLDAAWGAESAQLLQRVREREARTGRPHFLETFVDGREFNLSLLDDGDGEPRVLPPAEIDFSAFPPEKPRIVGHKAKWIPDSFEYAQTPRRFEFPPSDQPLLGRLSELARRCWRLFELRGYARVDFRVDHRGRPWILEINVNPCLAPDAGFAAAVEQAGVPYAEAVERILLAALPGGEG